MERETKAFRYEIVFRGIQPCFLHGESERLACLEPTKASRFCEDTWDTFRTLWSKKSSFLKRNFCVYKGFVDVFYIGIGVKEKPQNVHLKLIFLPCARPI